MQHNLQYAKPQEKPPLKDEKVMEVDKKNWYKKLTRAKLSGFSLISCQNEPEVVQELIP